MSPHQIACKMVAEHFDCPEEQAANWPLTKKFTTAIQAASNAELTRRREKAAGLEAALKRGIQGLRNIIEMRRMTNGRYGNLTREEIEGSIAEAEAALSGGTAALDAVVAEAVAKVEEQHSEAEFKRGLRYALGDVAVTLGMGAIEVHHKGELWVEKLYARDARLAAEAVAKVTEERDAAANLLADTLCELRNHDGHPYCQVGVQMDIPDAKDAEKHLAARDSRVKAEGRREGLEEAADVVSRIQLVRPRIVAELRKLAAQAGEATNAL